jgi:hypothetical protein
MSGTGFRALYNPPATQEPLRTLLAPGRTAQQGGGEGNQ